MTSTWEFLNPVRWAGLWYTNGLFWAVLAAIPPLIILLYFLKLKRRPVEVPSTYLWHKSIEDLHVNSVWQRLRRNLLLLLQLLLLVLVMLALLRPNWRGMRLSGERVIFLIDTSASMQATDVEPSRLEAAKRKVGELIDQMKSGDVAMLISFSDTARVEQAFTDNRRLLRRRLEAIQPTQRSTSLLEALKVASGLANPGHTAEEDDEYRVAEALPAEVFIFSDGRFAPVTDFSLGHLKIGNPDEPGGAFVPVGDPGAANVSILAFNVRRHEERPGELQAFARLEFFPGFLFNMGLEYQSDLHDGALSQAFCQEFRDRSLSLSGRAAVTTRRAGDGWQISDQDQTYLVARGRSLKVYGPAEVSVLVELFREGEDEPIDAARLEMAAGEARGVTFELGAIQSGALRLRATTTDDDLPVDDEAYVVVIPPRRARVLLVTPGNEPLELALQTDSAMEMADVQVEALKFLKSKPYREQAYDLIIYDRCRPEKMPQANTFFIGSLPPPEAGWSAEPKAGPAQIVDFEATHPLLHWMDLLNVILVEGTALKPPPGGSVLADADMADADAAPVLAIAPRERFEDAVLGFAIIDEQAGPDETPQKYRNTNWPTLQSFPVFVRNLLDYLGGSRDELSYGSVQPGNPVTLEAPAPRARLDVHTPDPESDPVRLEGDKSGKFNFTGTEELGVYEARSGKETVRQFAVNLFDAKESDIRPDPNPSIRIGYVEVPGQAGWEGTSREIWKGLLLLGLAVLMLEWYIYNRRVYV